MGAAFEVEFFGEGELFFEELVEFEVFEGFVVLQLVEVEVDLVVELGVQDVFVSFVGWD